MQTTKITVCKNYWGFNISYVEAKFNAIYIGDFSVKDKHGVWSDKPCSIFYQENPDTSKGHSHYFGLFLRYNDIEDLTDTTLLITNGESAFSEPLTGAMADNGEIIVSCFPHDYRESEDGTAMIDGGRSGYIRHRNNKLVEIKVVKDKFEVGESKLNLEIL